MTTEVTVKTDKVPPKGHPKYNTLLRKWATIIGTDLNDASIRVEFEKKR